MTYTLQDIQRIAAERFPFDQEHYPELPEGEPEADAFARRHLLLHLVKNVGEIAAAIEPHDHGRAGAPLTPQVIRKLLVNAIRLADVSGISMEDIQASLENWAKGKER